mgnify:CR=1 FL=1
MASYELPRGGVLDEGPLLREEGRDKFGGKLVPVLRTEGLGLVLGEHHLGEGLAPRLDGGLEAGPKRPHLGNPEA